MIRERMTLKQVIELTRIRDCPECHLRHAAIRTCEEAALEEALVRSKEAD